jgi:hypothetical protein
MRYWTCRVVCEFPVAGGKDRKFEIEIETPPFGVGTGDWLVNLPGTDLFDAKDMMAPWEYDGVSGKLIDYKEKIVDIEFSFVRERTDCWDEEIAILEKSCWQERVCDY